VDRATAFVVRRHSLRRLQLWRRRRRDLDVCWDGGPLGSVVVYWGPSSVSQRHVLPPPTAGLQTVLRRKHENSPVYHIALVGVNELGPNSIQ